MGTNFDPSVIDSCVNLSKRVQEEFRPVVNNFVIDEEDDFLRDTLHIVIESVKLGKSIWNDSSMVISSYNSVQTKVRNATGYFYLMESFCRYFPEFTSEAFDSLLVLSCIESLYDFSCDIMSRGSRGSVMKAMEIEHLLTDLFTEYKDDWDKFTELQKQIVDVFVDKKYYGFMQYCAVLTPNKFWDWADSHSLVTKSVRKNGSICYKAVSDDKTRDYKSLVSKGLGSIADFGLLTFVVNIYVRWFSLASSKFNIVMDQCSDMLMSALSGEGSTEIITDVMSCVAKAYVHCEGINEKVFNRFQSIGLYSGLNFKTATGKQLFDAVRLSLKGFSDFNTLLTIDDVLSDPMKAMSMLNTKE